MGLADKSVTNRRKRFKPVRITADKRANNSVWSPQVRFTEASFWCVIVCDFCFEAESGFFDFSHGRIKIRCVKVDHFQGIAIGTTRRVPDLEIRTGGKLDEPDAKLRSGRLKRDFQTFLILCSPDFGGFRCGPFQTTNFLKAECGEECNVSFYVARRDDGPVNAESFRGLTWGGHETRSLIGL